IPFVVCNSYGKADGMASRECNGTSQPAGWKASNGELWFPTIKGVVAVNPRRLTMNSVMPPVTIEDVIIDKQVVPFGDNIETSPGKGELEIHYAGLSFRAPEKVQFKYLLNGFDRDWISVGTRRIAYYTNLPPGHYIFQVRAQNENGVWSQSGASVAIFLEPHFYQQFWFYALLTVGILALAILSVWLRIRALTIRQKLLVGLIEERTKSLREEKERAEQAQREAQHHEEVAIDADKVKTELLNIAAHDMKSPLISIRTLAQIIRNDPIESLQKTDFAQEIVEASQRMLALINALLEASSMEGGRLALAKVACDISSLAASVVELESISAARKNQQIKFSGDGAARVLIDEDRMRQVMENLVDNAVKFSNPGTVIEVSVRRENGSVNFSVKDNGPGLTENDKGKLFGKFQRLSARPTGGESSTGLGLSIVKRLVELQGGTITVESEKGRGAKFVVSLPPCD
ncbi:MAG TPA: ATP-binding protein, partial [Bacteroidota bacterium]|nr:ATP-binding protein [Bacteroidota bacterium]